MRYAGAIALFVVAWGLTEYARDPAGSAPLFLFLTVVMVLSWVGSTRAALIACAASVPVLALPLPDLHRPRDVAVHVFRLLAYVACTALVCWMNARRRRAEASLLRSRDEMERAVRERTAALTDLNRRLQRETDERRRAVQEVAHVSRFTTLGQFAAAIAHEVSQPLTAIGWNAIACVRWLQATPPDIARATEAAEQAALGSSRASDLLERIADLVRGKPPARDLIDLPLLIESSIAIVRPSLEQYQVDVIVQGPGQAPADGQPDEGPELYGDRIQLQQVLLNLLSNAIDALRETAVPRRIEILISREPDGPVLIVVRDNGPGLTPDQLSRIFDPFYTTKPEGLGMGLPLSRTIVQAHGGRLWAATRKEGGAAFFVSLPVEPPSEPAAPGPSPSSAPTTPTAPTTRTAPPAPTGGDALRS